MSDYFGTQPTSYQTPLLVQNNFSDITNLTLARSNLGAASSDDVLKAANPIGTIIAYYGSVAPYGYLPCSGQTVSNATFPSLVTFLGGTTSAALPDLRGEFLRGWDNGRGVDTGRVIKAWQADMFASHNHGITGSVASATGGVSGNPVNPTGVNTWLTNSTGGTETRPRNVAVLYCMKAYDTPSSTYSLNVTNLVNELAGLATAPQFDNSTTRATTAFVKRSGQQYSSITPFTGSTLAGVAGHIGGFIYGYGASVNTYSLPDSAGNSLPVGACVRVANFGTTGISIARQGSDVLQSSNTTASAANQNVPPGTYIDFIYVGSLTWFMMGTGVLSVSSDFYSVLSTNGYQKLPSGLILQWGLTGQSSGSADVTVTLQIGRASCSERV